MNTSLTKCNEFIALTNEVYEAIEAKMKLDRPAVRFRQNNNFSDKDIGEILHDANTGEVDREKLQLRKKLFQAPLEDNVLLL